MAHKKNLTVVFCIFVLLLALCGSAAAQFDLGGGEGAESPLDLLKKRDENLAVVEKDGIPTWISGNLTDTLVTDAESAQKAFHELISVMGADEHTEFVLDSMLEDDSNYHYYVFQQYYNSVSIIDSAAKLIVAPDGHVAGITGKVTPIDPEDYDLEKTVDEGTALQIVKDAVKKEDPDHEYVFSEDMDAAYLTLPVPGIEETDAGTSTKAFYIFYSNNPNASNDKHDLPILAHYVTMSGIFAGSQPCTYKGDSDALSGSTAESFFSHMTADTWTGNVTDHNGNTRQITVPVMKDEDGVTWLGDLKRKIIIAECADLINEKSMEESALNSERNETWPNKVLMAYENYIKVWDFYDELGWTGPDGTGGPMVIMNNYVNARLEPVDNAVYMGYDGGYHLFATSELNNYCECLDVIGHEYTHAVTSSAMIMNLYINEYGAINEAMSDIMGNIIEMSLGATEDKDWLLGENSGQAVRSMSDPHTYRQPEFIGDHYWVPKAGTYNEVMDFGGVHTNSSLLNRVAYLLYKEGMTMDELRHLFSGVICGMIPTTGNAEMAQLLLFSAKISNLEQFSDLITKICKENGYGINASILLRVPDGHGRIQMNVPDEEPFDRSADIIMAMNMEEFALSLLFSSMDPDADMEDPSILFGLMMKNAEMTWADYETGQVTAALPEGNYILMYMHETETDSGTAVWNGKQWVSMADDAGGFGSGTVHVQAGCETWVSNAGLAEALSGKDSK